MVDSQIRGDIRRIIDEDLAEGDITTESLIGEGVKAEGKIIAEDEGYIAGLPEVLLIFEELEVNMRAKVSDGNEFKRDDVIVELDGFARDIFSGRDISLNLLSHMSGVATVTRKMVDLAKKENSDIVIAATRKTTPLLRRFEKRAVKIGGGEPHRYHLGDFISINRDHIKFIGSISEAIQKAKKFDLQERIEVEIKDEKEAIEAAKSDADILMLRNSEPSEIESIANYLSKKGFREKILLEIYGDLSPKQVKKYSKTKIDIIATEYITKNSPNLDFRLKIERQD